MSTMKEWLVQVRYPYTAGVIAVIWLGTAAFAYIAPDTPAEMLLGMVALSTLLIASVGFSSRR